MKRTVALGLFSLVLIFAFAAVPVVGILSVSVQNTGGENLTLDIPDSVGTGTVDTPLTKRQLQKKYAKYNTVAEENGKSVVTIFSEEQIDDFNARRNNGEWFWLSTEEMLFLIEDTISLFETYDIVYIRGLDGVLHKYYGLSFFSSEEYFASFGGFDLGVTDASFDLKQDVYETILERTIVLNDAVIKSHVLEQISILTDLYRIPRQSEWECLTKQQNPWNKHSDLKTHDPIIQYNIWIFNQENIYHKRITEETDFFYSLSETHNVFTDNILPKGVSPFKYAATGKNVIVELYEENSEKMIARIRLNQEETAQAENLLIEFGNSYGNPDNTMQEADYRAMIYYSGMHFEFSTNGYGALYYCPDGDLSLCNPYGSYGNALQHDFFHMSNFEKVAEYLNSILKTRLQ